MPRRAVYHLDLDDEKIQEAGFALLPGDPFRSGLIAERSELRDGILDPPDRL